MRKFAKLLIIPIIFLSGCMVLKDANQDVTTTVEIEEKKPEKEPTKEKNPSHHNPYKEYKASARQAHALIHTKLDLSFDMPNEQLHGKAEITLKPFFYAADSVVLDARGFDIHKVGLINKNGKISDLTYSYSGERLTVYTRKYQRSDTFRLFINYTANPAKLTGGGSWAISGNSGMYFQNPKSDNPQVWTQGQPNANSGWFPTIDQPNQRMTQEILLTVDKDFETISNGKQTAVLLNDDGTKTVRWVQSLPHAPYLAAVVVGRFDIIKYYWRDKPVFVYVEEGERNAAVPTFEKTAEMIEFFSRKFKFDYPWDKYSQVVVRNFISGAMENTGAVIFSRYFLSDPDAEFYRPTHELIVAHELFHHWFGNLVTCESWANLTLNEAFASYSEYLWLEHKYGRFHADKHLDEDKRQYFFESLYKNEDLIRYYHQDAGDMFDAHSYQKGAAILHTLRYEVGDEAFFESLCRYINQHAYSSVEVHDLRLAFEEVTGRDLNYFFDSWFLNKGYPELDIRYETSDSLNWKISLKQVQSPKYAPLYKLHLPVDFYFPDTLIRRTVLMDKEFHLYEFSFDQKVQFVKLDAENSLLCKKEENRSMADYIFILKHVNNFYDQRDAVKALAGKINKTAVAEGFMALLDSPYYAFRKVALINIPHRKTAAYYDDFVKKVKQMAENDPDLEIRQTALELAERMD